MGMTAISIFPERRSGIEPGFRAVAGTRQSVGKTPGEALDAIRTQLDGDDGAGFLVVPQMRPDRFFTAEQIQRLSNLMDAWREARDRGETLPADQQAELEKLVDEELEGATKRAAALFGEPAP